jgi:hypothetical protein
MKKHPPIPSTLAPDLSDEEMRKSETCPVTKRRNLHVIIRRALSRQGGAGDRGHDTLPHPIQTIRRVERVRKYGLLGVT